ncbi:type II toxin-antitoxin system mRNA interferase toxin, RelE/StbE family [Candidatus Gottesmanbacteria bacterium]|nr:type II toxin-antitoxin system mRNA interferase toxin, RelE/StbE family [Candidatus Gottesmanbacteria bacterium]MBI3443751.1 type II toxin-antitoxin system mRNA interferase toxin, RelE/StbE family [Candidatus Woesebacteria bacterium]
MHVEISSNLKKKLKKLSKTDKQLTERVQKQLNLFLSNPKHPSLRTNKLSGNLNNMRSISVTESIRMTYLLLETDTAYFVDIGTHDEVYKRNS